MLRQAAGLYWYLGTDYRAQMRGYTGSLCGNGRCGLCGRYAKVVACGLAVDGEGEWYGVDCWLCGESIMDGAWYRVRGGYERRFV